MLGGEWWRGLRSVVACSLQKQHGTSQLLPFHSFQSLWHEGSGQLFVSSFPHHVDEFTDQWAANTEHVFKPGTAFISGVFLSCCSNFSVSSAMGLLLVSLAIPVFKTIAASLGLVSSRSLHPASWLPGRPARSALLCLGEWNKTGKGFPGF